MVVQHEEQTFKKTKTILCLLMMSFDCECKCECASDYKNSPIPVDDVDRLNRQWCSVKPEQSWSAAAENQPGGVH